MADALALGALLAAATLGTLLISEIVYRGLVAVSWLIDLVR